ncbi:MAG: Universal stress protein [Lentisphaerae bacterium ADurb.BinA184]|mgnify:CR=1 FL=1|nr:MAG: Universal stress protein [Lentisphaerae bacterium ADurb.BinA184]
MDQNPVAHSQLIRRILFCTDFSPNADFAFDYAIAATIAHPGSTLFLLHVIPEPEAQFWKTYVYEIEDVDAKAKQAIDERVAAYRARLPAGIGFQPEYRVGKDWQEILKFADGQRIDLIVMGRHGRSGLEKVFFGNVTERVARRAPCPVLIVPWSFRRVVGDLGEAAAPPPAQA